MINEREVRDALDQLAADDDVERRWDDVLRRAAEPPRRRRRRRRGVLAAVALAVAAPAIAAGAFQLTRSDEGPIVARAHVEDRSLPVSADLRGRPSRTFTHAPTTGRAFGTRDFRWTLTIEEPAARRVKAELVVAGRRPVALCDPCRARSSGLAPRIRALWLNIADKHVQLRISVAGKTLSAPLRLAR